MNHRKTASRDFDVIGLQPPIEARQENPQALI
jgi:hypothetical protein